MGCGAEVSAIQMVEMRKKPKICIVTTIDSSLDKLFPDFYPLLRDKDYEVVGICADGPYVENIRRQGVRVITVPMTREFTPIQDLKCLWLLYIESNAPTMVFHKAR